MVCSFVVCLVNTPNSIIECSHVTIFYDEQTDLYQPTYTPEFNMEPENCQKEIRSVVDDFPQPL